MINLAGVLNLNSAFHRLIIEKSMITLINTISNKSEIFIQ